MRKRALKLTKEWHCKLMRTCFEAIRENIVNDKKFARKIVQIAQRVMSLDVAKSF